MTKHCLTSSIKQNSNNLENQEISELETKEVCPGISGFFKVAPLYNVSSSLSLVTFTSFK